MPCARPRERPSRALRLRVAVIPRDDRRAVRIPRRAPPGPAHGLTLPYRASPTMEGAAFHRPRRFRRSTGVLSRDQPPHRRSHRHPHHGGRTRHGSHQGLRTGRDPGRRAGPGVGRVPRGGVHRDHGPLRLRQVHPHALHGRTGRDIPRLGPDRRHRAERPEGQAPDPAAPRQDRLHLPGVQPAAHADRAGEHHAADGHRRAQARPAVAGPRRRDRRSVRAPQAPSQPAVRRPAAARRGGPRAGLAARDHLRRRAHRQPRLPLRRRGPGLSAQLRTGTGPDHGDGDHDPVAAAYAGTA
ncbi:hypothetical protein SRIMM317S_06820 [Streptomyces rimosus subsp. rimosus]